MKRATVTSSETLFKGRVFTLQRDHVVEPSGIKTVREVIVHHGSVVVLPVLPDGRIVLIRQYRHAAGQYLWELVAGHKEPGEDPVAGARRELEEETGYTARSDSRSCSTFTLARACSAKKWRYFWPMGLKKGVARPEDDEKHHAANLHAARSREMDSLGKIRRFQDGVGDSLTTRSSWRARKKRAAWKIKRSRRFCARRRSYSKLTAR